VATDSATLTLDHVWRVLAAAGHPAALMGGMSLPAWNHIRGTRDVDLLIAIERTNVDELIQLLIAAGCKPMRSTPLVEVGNYHFIQLFYTPPEEFYEIQIDLMLAEGEFHKSAFARRVSRSIPGVRVPLEVVSCEDLILFKLIAGRVLDRFDVAMLLRENYDSLDQSYLQLWLKKLHVEADYATCLAEAFPPDAPLQ
jgi:hypothetical protein